MTDNHKTAVGNFGTRVLSMTLPHESCDYQNCSPK